MPLGLGTPTDDYPWFHGDLQGNLIAREGRLVGVIDSGYGVDDPACDLTPGWIMFNGDARERFFDEVGLDDAAKARARGWLLAPACVSLTYYRRSPGVPGESTRVDRGCALY